MGQWGQHPRGHELDRRGTAERLLRISPGAQRGDDRAAARGRCGRLQFSETLNYQQHYFSFAQTFDSTMTPNQTTTGEGFNQILVNESASISRNVPVRPSLGNWEFNSPDYSLVVTALSHTDDGRILAQVTVHFHSVPWSATFSQRAREVQVGGDASIPPQTVNKAPRTFDLESSPGVGNVTVLVDMTRRDVLARTSPPVITVNRTGVFADGLHQVRLFSKNRFFEFDEDGEIIATHFTYGGFSDLLAASSCPGSPTGILTLGRHTADERGSVTKDYLHPDLAPLAFSPSVELRTNPGELLVGCPLPGEDAPGSAFS